MKGERSGMAEAALRVGVCGSGITTFHIEGYQKIPGVEVVAIAGPDVERCESVAATYDIPHVFADYREMLEIGLDAVSIAFPNALHAPVAVDALQAGCHVLCEKPLADNAANAQRVVEAVRASDRVFMMAFCRRYLLTSMALKRQVDAGTLGPIYHATATWLRRSGIPGFGRWFTNKELAGGGPVIDVGVHVLDLALYLMGYPEPVSVSGVTHAEFGPRGKGTMSYGGPVADLSTGHFDVEDFASGLVRFSNGADLVLETSWAGYQIPRSNLGLTLYGRDGGARLDHSTGKPHTLDVVTEIGGSYVQMQPIIDEVEGINEYDREVAAFVQTIRGGAPSPAPVEQGYTLMRIIDALYRSAETGKQVDLSAD